ncbi:SNU71 [Candida margitis]|uniref:SNU71 n=1 Tax=Candida margitis TaxID=1775924 RepID=UPI002226899D|nr:SNU71 [Candida margitis]KAI5954150.1 SNU71 [Candida margitis]
MPVSASSDIAYTSPFTIPSSNNSKLISLLSEHRDESAKQETTPEAPLPLNFNIPTASQFDASNLIELNNTKILSQSSEQQSNKKQLVSNTTVEAIDENDEPKLLIEIKTIQPTNMQQQLSTVVFNNFPNLKNIVVEQVLASMINLNTDKSTNRHPSFHWSQINYEFTDSKVILVKFDKVEDAKWFIETYSHIDTLLPKVEMIYSHQVRDKLANLPSQPSSNPDSLKSKLKLILYTTKNFAKPKVQGLEELDKVMQSYSDYKVDYNDLIDVPNEMKEGIIKDIIKFRSRMLLIEKENRQKQIEHDRLVTRNKLNELFNGMEKSGDQKKLKEKGSSTDVSRKEEDIVIPDQYEHLNDEEYYNMIHENETNEYNLKYQSHLKDVTKQQASSKLKLETELGKLLNYEADLLDSKLNQIDKLKNYEKLEITTMYTYRYNDYLKQRNGKRLLEMKLDAEDSAAEEKEHEGEVKHEPKETQAKKQKLEASTKPKLSDLPEIKSLSKELRVQIHDKIINLVEEYLGVQDEFLVDVIKQHLETNSFNGRSALVSDLFEVLDEDAENLVNDLYKFIESVAK